MKESQNVDDILEGLSPHDCVAILVNCIKNAEKQLAEIFSNTEETKSSQVKGEQHLIELFKTLLLTYGKSDEYKRERAEREKIMKGMQKN